MRSPLVQEIAGAAGPVDLPLRLSLWKAAAVSAMRADFANIGSLEQQAGIGDAAGRAWEGPWFPRGASSDAPFGCDTTVNSGFAGTNMH